jgi:GAF domain-containing protein
MSDTHSPDPITDPARLAALHDAKLLDAPAEAEFDRLTARASELLHAPIALVSLVDVDRQFFKSSVGLNAPWSAARQTGLDMSVCQHVVRGGSAIAIADTREDARVRESHKIADAGVVAYAGVPLTTSDGHTLGSFCVIDSRPREWQSGELALLTELAAIATALIEERTSRTHGSPSPSASAAASPASRADAAAHADGGGAEAAASALAGADRLWEAAEGLHGALEAYDGAVRQPQGRDGVTQRQRAAHAQVDAARGALRDAAEAFGAENAPSLSRLPPTLGAPARALWLAALYYLERDDARRDVSARFQAEAGGMEELERASLLLRSAHNELEERAAAYRLVRLERRTRPR